MSYGCTREVWRARKKRKGRFTRYDFVAYDKLTTGLRHELFRVNQTYNSLNGPKSCRRPVVSLSYATKSYRVNRPLELLGAQPRATLAS